ncbi:MAG: DNA mismatch repair endonuclease MutL [Candidatus Thalassarchaeaceae archaeon]|jgi:DNA mismatch repair protein MutL|nr:DNA mismatch repair endonuclease MutL [Candidatus Thalassarchaeaceae archaeon]
MILKRGQIQQLDDATIGRIAAGEVVERPAQVVKELVENSLDAGSKNISIVVEDGGFTRLSVEDDGHGIPESELHLAVNRHATSKLRTSEDLSDIGTLGFRGEALAAIGSVSHLRIESKLLDHDGSFIEVKDGEVHPIGPVGKSVGTRIEVKDIFSSVPARMAFQRRPSTESAAIVDVVMAYALAHPDVGFSIRVDGRPILSSPGPTTPESRLFDVLGGSSERLIEIALPPSDESAPGDERWRGWISPPSVDRGRSDEIHVFVNNRAVAATPFLQSIRRGYQTRLMVGRHPVCVLFLDLPNNEVDVNVHPTKREVRLKNSWRVLERLERSIAHTLLSVPTGAPATPDFPLGSVASNDNEKQKPLPQSKEPAWIEAASSVQTRFNQPISPNNDSQIKRPRPLSHSPAVQETLPGLDDSPISPALSIAERSLHRYSGNGDPVLPTSEPEFKGPVTDVPAMEPLSQFADTYILAQGGESLFVVDQHALHERIRYERLRHDMTSWEAQSLIDPIIIELTVRQTEIIDSNREKLGELGFSFGEDVIGEIHSVPRLLLGDDRLIGFIRDLLSDLSEGDGVILDSVDSLQDEIAFMKSCRGAVKANQRLELAEMRRLLADMSTIENPWACVHGRPTVLKLEMSQLDDHFGRLG